MILRNHYNCNTFNDMLAMLCCYGGTTLIWNLGDPGWYLCQLCSKDGEDSIWLGPDEVQFQDSGLCQNTAYQPTWLCLLLLVSATIFITLTYIRGGLRGPGPPKYKKRK